MYKQKCEFDCTELKCKTEVEMPTALELSLGAEVYENGEKSNCIIRYDKPWRVHVRWCFHGALAPCICGYWCVQLFLESIGPGPELTVPPKGEPHTIRLDPCGSGCYDYDITVPPGTITTEHCGRPYKAVIGLTYLDMCKDPGPVVGFCELPLLQFYETGKPVT